MNYKRVKTLLVQLFFSAIILLAVFFISEQENQYAKNIIDMLKSELNTNFDFAKVKNFYQNNFQGNISFLPTFVIEAQKEEVNAPIAINTIAQVKHDLQGVWITANQQTIKTIDKGWVIFAGERGEYGKTIIIRHTNNRESWYAHLADLYVKKDDWIEKGENIAIAPVNKEGYINFYFAYKKAGNFIDPIGVVPFE